MRFLTHASSVLPVYPKLLFLNFITYDYVPVLKFCAVKSAPLLNLLLTSRAFKSLTYILLITVCIELYLLTSTYLLLSVGDYNKLRVARYLRTYLRTVRSFQGYLLSGLRTSSDTPNRAQGFGKSIYFRLWLNIKWRTCTDGALYRMFRIRSVKRRRVTVWLISSNNCCINAVRLSTSIPIRAF